MYVLIEFDLKLQRSVTTPGLWTVTLRLGPVGRGARSKAYTTLGGRSCRCLRLFIAVG